MDYPSLQIVHKPLGLEHPYHQEATERTPRQPRAGQPVTLGAATTPAGAAYQVWATWQSSAGEQRTARGVWIEDKEGRSLWRVHLPAFGAGEQVIYRLHALGNEGEIHTPQFSFTSAYWQTAGDLVEWQFTDDNLVLQQDYSTIAIHFPQPNQVRLRLTLGSAVLPELPRGTLAGLSQSIRLAREDSEEIVVDTTSLRLRIRRHPLSLALEFPDGTPLLRQVSPPAWLLGEADRALAVRMEFESPPDEGYYGFG